MDSKTKPGSRAHRYVEIIRERARELGRGLRIKEIREAYEEETGEPAPDALTAEISSLKQRGVLEMTGGRPGRSRYAPADLDLDDHEADEPTDDVVVVLKAVRRGYERLDRALSTGEVTDEIERGGESLQSDDPNAVKKRLDTLSRRTERGPEGTQAPRVRRIEATSMLGQPSNHWVPAGVDAPAKELIAPRSKADAIRQFVGLAEEDIGRPPSRAELHWWLESPAAPDPLCSVLDTDTLGTRLSDTGRRDQARTGEKGRLQEVSSPLACDGGAPRRWTLQKVDSADQALSELADTLHLYRVAEELRSVRALQRRADRDGGVLRDLASTRRRLVFDSLQSAVGEYDPVSLLDRLEDTYRTLQGRVEASQGLSDDVRSERRSTLRKRLYSVRSVKGVLRSVDAPDDAVQVECAGEAGTIGLGELEPVLDTVGDILQLDGRQQRRIVKRVRRFPLPEEWAPSAFGTDATPPYSALDRPDAFQALFELFTVPRAQNLLTEARHLLGHVLRDASYVRVLIDELGASSPPERSALIVALGLLGVPAEFSRVVPDPGDVDTVTAWAFGTVLAEWQDAEDTLQQAASRASGPAQEVLEAAVRRIRAGYLPSAIG